jgi:adenosylmethionine---8-amino-7-oxononanoate aminotransferase
LVIGASMPSLKLMPTFQELATWDHKHYWHAFTQMAEYVPLVIERAEGVWLYDASGKRYLDGISSMWCNLHGHRHPAIDAAIKDQLDKVAHATSLGMATPPAIELAKRLAELAPGDLNHVFFGGDGSSAIEAALKIAFQYWRQCKSPRPTKSRFIALGEAYHGDTLGSSSVGGIDRFNAIFQPLLFDVIRLRTPDREKMPSGAGAEYYLAELEEVLAAEHQTIAAMVIEPCIQAAAGMIFHPRGYLSGVRDLTRKYNVMMIADEIVTGCGRLGHISACEMESVVPDLLCLGKSLTGGYLPLSATIATNDIYNAFLGTVASGRSFRHGHTYAGNPLGAAAALATLELSTSEESQRRLPKQIEELTGILASLQALPHVATTRQLGMIAAVEFTPTGNEKDRYPVELRIAYQICCEALKRGMWLRPLGDTLVIMPPLCIKNDELVFFGRVLSESVEFVTANPLPAEAVSHIAGDD